MTVKNIRFFLRIRIPGSGQKSSGFATILLGLKFSFIEHPSLPLLHFSAFVFLVFFPLSPLFLFRLFRFSLSYFSVLHGSAFKKSSRIQGVKMLRKCTGSFIRWILNWKFNSKDSFVILKIIFSLLIFNDFFYVILTY